MSILSIIADNTKHDQVNKMEIDILYQLMISALEQNSRHDELCRQFAEINIHLVGS